VTRTRCGRVRVLALAAALSTAGTWLLTGPAHAAPTPTTSPSSSSPSSSSPSSSSPASADGASREQAPRPPAAADPEDQHARDSPWGQILDKLGLGDNDSPRGADEDSSDKDSASTPSTAAAQSTATTTTTPTPSADRSASGQQRQWAAAPVGSSASGQEMPTTAPAGWSQVLADDFTTPAALGTFPGLAYAARWGGYNGFTDTSGVGTYTPDPVDLRAVLGAFPRRRHSRVQDGLAAVAGLR